eukprot:TRINITY_DN23650_c0_g1_i1.p1 TRINITY_DN23650_c0_g1~~TRINITY_DN23650_c0_g1_i1.p1  ORF type:complete len:126 (-),score=22.38 TRINITY_DN23650_c0_g1_i1:28-405(-)
MGCCGAKKTCSEGIKGQTDSKSKSSSAPTAVEIPVEEQSNIEPCVGLGYLNSELSRARTLYTQGDQKASTALVEKLLKQATAHLDDVPEAAYSDTLALLRVIGDVLSALSAQRPAELIPWPRSSE